MFRKQKRICAYVVEGATQAGGVPLEKGQVGWFDRPSAVGVSTLKMAAGSSGARIILYAGEPQNEPLVHHGPFVAGAIAEIEELLRRYRAGQFQSMSAIAHKESLTR